MKVFRWLILASLLLVSILLSGCNLPINLKNPKAGLQVSANPQATVFLNDNHLGQTPYLDEKHKPGDYTLKLVPEGDDKKLPSWQGMVKLSSGVFTVVEHTFAETEEQSSGFVLSLEPIAEKDKVKISIISIPDSVIVNLNGEPKGFTPLALEDINEGEHLLKISYPGYVEKEVKAKAIKGYKLTVNVQLAKEIETTQEATSSATPSASPATNQKKASPSPSPKSSPKTQISATATPAAETMDRPYVTIKTTPTGWLNVRSEPSISGGDQTILTKVYPGKNYKFIEANSTGWYKIEYEEGNLGWISSRYAALYN